MSDYEQTVRQFSDDELLKKERSKRMRKTGDVVGTGLSAAAAMATPALWAAAGAGAKSYLDNNTKHNIIMKEVKRRGLTPLKGDLKDSILPILASAGGMMVGRAVGGTSGQGMASAAGNIIQSVGSRAFSSSDSSKKDKSAKKSKQEQQHQQKAPAGFATAALATPSAYVVPPNQMPPQQIVYNYIAPSKDYPNGHYVVAQVQTPPSSPPMTPQGPPPMAPQFQQYPPMSPPQTPVQQPQNYTQNYSQVPPALAYLNTPPQPQYYRNLQPQPPVSPAMSRASSFYTASEYHTPMQSPTLSPLGRAQTYPYM